MATAKKSAAKKAAPTKATTEKTSPQVEDQKAESIIPPKLDEPQQCYEAKQRSESDRPTFNEMLREVFGNTIDQELPKTEQILRILNGSDPYETRQILEDVGIQIKRKVEDNLREQERVLEQLRRNS
jgi:hypothetical protein